jgi:hypothetical protein
MQLENIMTCAFIFIYELPLHRCWNNYFKYKWNQIFLKYFPCFDQAQTNEDLGCWILDASNESNIFMVKLSLSPTLHISFFRLCMFGIQAFGISLEAGSQLFLNFTNS